MIVVVDQNMMRKEELRRLVETDPVISFVVPDAAFEEMTRDACWEETLRGSFAILARALDRTFVGAPVGELLRYEQLQRSPVTREHILPAEISDCARELVEAVASGSEGSGGVRRRVEACRQHVQAERPADVDQKACLLVDVGRLKDLNGSDLTREIRAGRMDAAARLGLLKLRSEAVVEEFLGFDASTVDPSGPWSLMTTRFVAVELWYQERWLSKGGFTDVKPRTVANDAFDKEYALLASFFDGLLSIDAKAIACAEDLATLSDPGRGKGLMDAIEAHAVATGRLPS